MSNLVTSKLSLRQSSAAREFGDRKGVFPRLRWAEGFVFDQGIHRHGLEFGPQGFVRKGNLAILSESEEQTAEESKGCEQDGDDGNSGPTQGTSMKQSRTHDHP